MSESGEGGIFGKIAKAARGIPAKLGIGQPPENPTGMFHPDVEQRVKERIDRYSALPTKTHTAVDEAAREKVQDWERQKAQQKAQDEAALAEIRSGDLGDSLSRGRADKDGRT